MQARTYLIVGGGNAVMIFDSHQVEYQSVVPITTLLIIF